MKTNPRFTVFCHSIFTFFSAVSTIFIASSWMQNPGRGQKYMWEVSSATSSGGSCSLWLKYALVWADECLQTNCVHSVGLLIILLLTTVVTGNVIWDLAKEIIMEEKDWQRWRVERRDCEELREAGKKEEDRDEGWKEMKIIQLFFPSQHCWNLIGFPPKRRRERTN